MSSKNSTNEGWLTNNDSTSTLVVKNLEDDDTTAKDPSGAKIDLLKKDILEKAKKGVPLTEDQLAVIADDLGRDVPGYDPKLSFSEEEERKIRWILDVSIQILPFKLGTIYIRGTITPTHAYPHY
jgi:hypothetical protein